MSVRAFFLRLFTWWNQQTFGTWFYTWRCGHFVGEDSLGHRYYENAEGRRWVIYPGYAEASSVPPHWNAWLQGRLSTPPLHLLPSYRWQKSPTSNKTGTPEAYLPPGSLLHNAPVGGSQGPGYQAWVPSLKKGEETL